MRRLVAGLLLSSLLCAPAMAVESITMAPLVLPPSNAPLPPPTPSASTMVNGLPDGYQPTVSVRLGSLGIGPEVGIRFPNSHWGLRANLNVFSYSDNSFYTHTFANNSLTSGYNVRAQFGGALRLLNGGLTADYYPLGSGLRLSAGLYGDGNRITGTANPSGTVRIGRTTYQASNAGTLSYQVLPNDVAPYVGFGYSGQIARHIVFSADAGILIEGNPSVAAQTHGPLASVPGFTQDVNHERARIQNDIDVPVYPVIMLGLGYRF